MKKVLPGAGGSLNGFSARTRPVASAVTDTTLTLHPSDKLTEERIGMGSSRDPDTCLMTSLSTTMGAVVGPGVGYGLRNEGAGVARAIIIHPVVNPVTG